MYWMDSLIQVDEGVTVGSYMINSLLFANDLVLLATMNKVFNTHLIGFQLRDTVEVSLAL